MRANWMRGLGLCLVLSFTALEVTAQRKGRGQEQPPVPSGTPEHNTCTAKGADCLFGHSGDCSVSCTEPAYPHCKSGGCVLGFPRAAECYCEGLDPT